MQPITELPSGADIVTTVLHGDYMVVIAEDGVYIYTEMNGLNKIEDFV